jgi:hypothetical protein
MTEIKVTHDACWWDKEGLNIEWINEDGSKRMWLCLGSELINNFYGWLEKDSNGELHTTTVKEIDWDKIHIKHKELFGEEQTY